MEKKNFQEDSTLEGVRILNTFLVLVSNISKNRLYLNQKEPHLCQSVDLGEKEKVLRLSVE